LRKNLTATSVEALKPLRDRQLDVWDTKRPGFGVRITPAGTKTWILMYRSEGRKYRLLLGRWPTMSVADARREAADRAGAIARGENPAADRSQAKSDPTFGEFGETYLKRHATVHKRARSVVEDRKMLRSTDLAPWKHRKLAAIEKRDVIAVLDKVVARGAPVQANRMRALLSKVFNFAVARDLLAINPTAGIPREPEKPRSRKLSDDELRNLWHVLDTQPRKIAAAFKLAVLTGARRSEVLGMAWSEINASWWNLPGERTKNGESHRIPLTPTAVALLEALPHTGAYVFPGGKKGQPLANIKKPLEKIRADAKLVNFHLHDLRRTVATRLAELGTDRTTLKKILNHTDSGDVTAVYDRHSYDAEKRAALIKWDRHLERLLTGASGESNVVQLHG
jgi:integrase